MNPVINHVRQGKHDQWSQARNDSAKKRKIEISEKRESKAEAACSSSLELFSLDLFDAGGREKECAEMQSAAYASLDSGNASRLDYIFIQLAGFENLQPLKSVLNYAKAHEFSIPQEILDKTLRRAVLELDYSICELMIEHGADPTQSVKGRASALDLAKDAAESRSEGKIIYELLSSSC